MTTINSNPMMLTAVFQPGNASLPTVSTAPSSCNSGDAPSEGSERDTSPTGSKQTAVASPTPSTPFVWGGTPCARLSDFGFSFLGLHRHRLDSALYCSSEVFGGIVLVWAHRGEACGAASERVLILRVVSCRFKYLFWVMIIVKLCRNRAHHVLIY